MSELDVTPEIYAAIANKNTRCVLAEGSKF